MEENLNRRIKIISLIAMILCTLVASAGIIILNSGLFEFEFTFEEVVISWLVAIMFPLISLLTSYSIFHKEKIFIRRTARLIFYSYPVVLIFSFLGIMNLSNTILMLAVILLFLFLTIVALMHIFVFSDAADLTGTIVFIFLIISSIILKRYHINYSGFFIALILAMFSIGCFMYGIRCIYLAEKNNYLKYAAFSGSFIVTIFFMSILWKMQHWPLGDSLMYSSNILLPLATIVILLTLPSSGFVEWKTLHKRILLRLLLPWTLIFLLFLLRYLFPEVNSIVWTRDVGQSSGSFDMPDYDIELKNDFEKQ